MVYEFNDKEVESIINEELERQQNNIELIASENIVSEDVLKATGSILTNKYAEGYPGARYYGGCEVVDKIEELARTRAKELFNTDYHVNVQPHSGSQANTAVYFAMLEVGDIVMGMSLDCGGHLTHGHPITYSGKTYNFIHYGVTKDTNRIDYDQMLLLAKEHKPKMIVCGASAYPREIDFIRIRQICDEVGALMMVDMAHIAGLIAAGLHQSPFGIADFITTTTHKTLRGTRGGMIFCKEEYAKKIDSAIFPKTQGGPLLHCIAGKAVCFGEALKPEFKEYQNQVIKNAKAMAKVFIDNGIDVVTGGTDNHLLLLDLRKIKITGKLAERILDNINITVNKNTIPYDPEKPSVTSGIRIGTPAITTRGFTEKDCEKVATLIVKALTNNEDNGIMDVIKGEVANLTAKYPIYKN